MGDLTIPEAAAALGVSVDTVRRRIRRGDLEARKDQRGRYVIYIEGIGAGAVVSAAPVDAVATQRDLDHTREMTAELRRQRDRLEERLAESRQAEGELRRLLANAQQQLGALLPAPPMPTTLDQEVGETPSTPPPEKRRGWWPFRRRRST